MANSRDKISVTVPPLMKKKKKWQRIRTTLLLSFIQQIKLIYQYDNKRTNEETNKQTNRPGFGGHFGANKKKILLIQFFFLLLNS